MDFYQKVYQITKKIPKSRVTTYGQIAALAGSPRSARVVGFALSRLDINSKIPWHRVINSQGKISIENLSVPKEIQVKLLQKEGIKIKKVGQDYFLNLNLYIWKKLKRY